jgi:aminoglycoside phosphotransferase (APT) family kinase protein
VTDVVDTAGQAAELDLPPLIIRDPLAEYLDSQGLGGGTPEVERIGEGQANLTFLLTGNGWRAVLRRPPRGDLPPTAFDVTREYRVMRALADHSAPVPVPRPLALCEDRSVIGVPFYLMEQVDGFVVRGEMPDELSSLEDRRLMSEQLVDTLVALQAVDWRAVGLEGFGKPDGYLARQIRRMRQLWELARFREIPDLEAIGAWLEENIPAGGDATIVHGDYKLDNVIFAPQSPARIVALVDWEMSTLGDPLADLGWLLYFWRDPGDETFRLTVGQVMDQEGFMRRPDLLARYAEKRRVPLDRIAWYVALAGWKIAIIMEGSYKRFLAGVGDHPAFAQLEEGVPALARRAADAMRGRLPL